MGDPELQCYGLSKASEGRLVKLPKKALKKHLKTKRKVVDKVQSDIQSDFFADPPNDGLLPPDEDMDKVREARGTPCTTLASTSPPEEGENSTSTNALIPQEEGMPTTLEMLKRKRMKMSGRHLPLVHCNICRFSQSCPQYKPGYECGFTNNILKSIEDVTDAKEFMRYLAELELSRAQQAAIFEQLSGGTLEEQTTLALSGAFEKLRTLVEMEEGPQETKQENSILEALFGGILREAKPLHKQEEEVIDITDEVTEDPEEKEV